MYFVLSSCSEELGKVRKCLYRMMGWCPVAPGLPGAQWLMCSLDPSWHFIFKILPACQLLNNLEVSFQVLYHLRWCDNSGAESAQGHLLHIDGPANVRPSSSVCHTVRPHLSRTILYLHFSLVTLDIWVKWTIDAPQSFSGTFTFTFPRHAQL